MIDEEWLEISWFVITKGMKAVSFVKKDTIKMYNSASFVNVFIDDDSFMICIVSCRVCPSWHDSLT